MPDLNYLPVDMETRSRTKTSTGSSETQEGLSGIFTR